MKIAKCGIFGEVPLPHLVAHVLGNFCTIFLHIESNHAKAKKVTSEFL